MRGVQVTYEYLLRGAEANDIIEATSFTTYQGLD